MTIATAEAKQMTHAITARKPAGTKNGERYTYLGEFVDGDAPNDMKHLLVVLEEDRAIISDADERETGELCEGTLDPTYKPRHNKGYVRYVGFGGFVPEYSTELLVQKKLLRGAEHGYVKIQDRGEGFFPSKFFCTRIK